MKQVFQIILSLGIGILIGWVIGCNGKIQTIEKEKVIVKIDTIREQVQVKIPEYRTKYVEITNVIFKEKIDSFFTEVIHRNEDDNLIPVNNYQDSISTEGYKLKYNVDVIGFMTDFKYDLSIYKKTEVITKFKPTKWMIGGAFSSNANFKLGAGYKGWTLEADFQKRLNQVWLGKQFNF